MGLSTPNAHALPPPPPTAPFPLPPTPLPQAAAPSTDALKEGAPTSPSPTSDGGAAASKVPIMLCDTRVFGVEAARERAVAALRVVDTPTDDPRFNTITRWVISLCLCLYVW